MATTDKFQGQQNDFILLSLVRTKHVGHIRDVRRLVVSVSRARLGLYVFCRRALFEDTVELRPTFAQLLAKPDALELLPAEREGRTARSIDQTVPPEAVTRTFIPSWSESSIPTCTSPTGAGGMPSTANLPRTTSFAPLARPTTSTSIFV